MSLVVAAWQRGDSPQLSPSVESWPLKRVGRPRTVRSIRTLVLRLELDEHGRIAAITSFLDRAPEEFEHADH